ncbi:MAG: choice-of-anchor D domain-containing protein, partial [Pseudomonadota bacterium]
LNNSVSVLAVMGTKLYVGGGFTRAGGIEANRIAVFDTTATGDAGWTSLGSGVNGVVRALAVIGTDLYVGGFFSQAGGSAASNVAVYDTTATGDAGWSNLGSGAVGNTGVLAMAVIGTDLYVAGPFTQAGGNVARRVAVYDTTLTGDAAWSALGDGLSNNSAAALAVMGTDLYVGGSFDGAGGNPASRIAVYDTTQSGDAGWSALGSGVIGSVRALAVIGTDLYVGGVLSQAGTGPVSNIAVYDSTLAGDTGWSALGSGVNISVVALQAVGNNLYVGGGFTQAGGSAASRIALYDSTQAGDAGWSALGSGADDDVRAFAVGTELYVGGVFTSAGGFVNHQFARYRTFSVSGMVSGLAPGSSVELTNTGSDILMIGANGPFTFATPLEDGADYSVTVATQPSVPSQTCTVSNGSGTIMGADVTNVQITCVTDQFTVGGTVSGLNGSGLVLQNNGGDDLTITGNEPFTFTTPLDDGTAYNVTVLVQPTDPSQTCTVKNGSGTLAGADVTNVEVTCSVDQFTVGGTVSGLDGDGLLLQNNDGDDLPIDENGSFTFATALNNDAAYDVSVAVQPDDLSQTCTVSNSSGTINEADVTDIQVTCVTNQFTVGGTVAGLSGAGLVLQNNGGDNLIIALNGAFAFPTALDDGLLYTVTVLSQPVDQDCSLNNSIGIINGRDVTSVSVICVASAAIDVMPEVLEFADQSLGVPSSPQMAVVESAGSGDLMIDSVNLLGIHGDDFQIIADTCADQSLPPDDFCGIEVTFTPTAGGVREAWIEIESNAQDSPSRIGLIGTNDVIIFDGFEGSEFDQ